MLVLYYPKCSTCRKALKWLDEHQIQYEKRDIAIDHPNEEELRKWHELSHQPLSKFFNTHGKIYRDLHLKTKLPQMSDDEKYALLASNGMIVKRPLVIDDDGGILIGFKEDEWKEYFQS